MAQDHEGRRLLVAQPSQGGDEAAAGDDEEVVDLRGVDLVAGVHEIAPLDDRPAVAGQLHVVEIEGPVGLDVDVLQEGLALQAGVVGLGLLAGIQAVGLDEQPARLEAVEGAVAGKRAAVVLDEPGALAALAGQHLAGRAGLAVGIGATNSE